MNSAYLRNTWYVAMWSQGLSAGQLTHRTILEEDIVFYRAGADALLALTDRCPHRGAPLHLGTILDDGRLQCGYHGLEFDSNGVCVRNPHGNGSIPPAARVRSYPIVERHGIVWIWMGDLEPQPDQIPDFSFLDNAPPENVSRRDWIRMDANYELITDNLLDLSHVSFLHDGILGNADTVHAETTVEQVGNSLEVTRFMPNVSPPGLFDMLFKRDGERVDLWNSIRWYPPGLMRNDAGVCPPGKDRSTGTGIFGMHLLTPETKTTTLYHFVALRQTPQNAAPADAETAKEIREKLSALRHTAFAEQDGPIIVAQQQNVVKANDEFRPVLLSIDVGPVRYKRILTTLISAERIQNGQLVDASTP